MKNPHKVSKILLYGSLLAFMAFVLYILHINQEVFYTAHDRSEFIVGEPFYHTLLSKPFGLMQYVGAWLTQYFYHPALGAGVLVAIWMLIFFVGAKAFRLRGSATALMILPVACLLTSVVDLGYWVYISTIRGYWFSQSVGYLVMLALLWAARSTPRKWHLAWYLLGFCIYPVLGWYALLFMLCLMISEKITWRELIGIVLLVFTAHIWHSQLYSNFKLDDVVLAGFPHFFTSLDNGRQLSIPFWVLGALSILIPLVSGLGNWSSGRLGNWSSGRLGNWSSGRLGKKSHATEQSSQTSQTTKGPILQTTNPLNDQTTKGPILQTTNPPNNQTTKRPIHQTTRFLPVVCVVAGIVFTLSLMFSDKNYIDEMRMVRHAEDDNWKEVIRMAEENKEPTRTMVFLKNIALMNEGGLLDRSFKLGNDAVSINNPDSLHVTLLEIASPLVYYNYGMMNEAIRLNFENGIQYGFSPFLLKTLSRCALAAGDEKLVERYTTILHHHPFYANWQPSPVTDKIKELQKAYPDELSGVENSDSYIVNSISLWTDSVSKVVSEQALLYSMIRCDSRRFWASLHNWVKSHMDEVFPLHAMEAYMLYMEKAPEKKRMMLPVSQTVYDRYKQFWETMEKLAKPGMNLESLGEQMREEFGDTYWWYNVFGKKPFAINGTIGHEVHS